MFWSKPPYEGQVLAKEMCFIRIGLLWKGSRYLLPSILRAEKLDEGGNLIIRKCLCEGRHAFAAVLDLRTNLFLGLAFADIAERGRLRGAKSFRTMTLGAA